MPQKSEIKETENFANKTNAKYEHVMLIDFLVRELRFEQADESTIHNFLILGEASTTYNSFRVSLLQYTHLLASDIYSTIKEGCKRTSPIF